MRTSSHSRQSEVVVGIGRMTVDAALRKNRCRTGSILEIWDQRKQARSGQRSVAVRVNSAKLVEVGCEPLVARRRAGSLRESR